MRRSGFTLIELLIVVVIIGVLASIAIPKFANSKEKAYLTQMKSDLRNLVTVEESYFADSIKYTNDVTGVYRTSTGVTGPNITLTPDGWTATVGHTAFGRTCAVFFGSTAQPPAVKEGVPTCG